MRALNQGDCVTHEVYAQVLPNPSPRSVCTTKICFVNVRDVDTVGQRRLKVMSEVVSRYLKAFAQLDESPVLQSASHFRD